MNLKSVIEALLFASHKPIAPKEIRGVLSADGGERPDPALAEFKKTKEEEIVAAIEELRAEYMKADRSFMIAEVAGGFQLVSRPDFGPWLKIFLNVDRPQRLSPSALETLAIIAYRQPITRSEVEKVRGVNIDGVLKTLLERGLVKITGRSEVPGKPIQYGTTHSFLEHFGLRDLEELPAMEELRRLEAKRQEALATQPLALAEGQAAPAEGTAPAPDNAAPASESAAPAAEANAPASEEAAPANEAASEEISAEPAKTEETEKKPEDAPPAE